MRRGRLRIGWLSSCGVSHTESSTTGLIKPWKGAVLPSSTDRHLFENLGLTPSITSSVNPACETQWKCTAGWEQPDLEAYLLSCIIPSPCTIILEDVGLLQLLAFRLECSWKCSCWCLCQRNGWCFTAAAVIMFLLSYSLVCRWALWWGWYNSPQEPSYMGMPVV